jgi:arginyl-tRNA synthetase
METIKEKLERILKQSVAVVTGDSVDKVEKLAITLESPKDTNRGDYSFAAMKIVVTDIATERKLMKKSLPAVPVVGTPLSAPGSTAEKLKKELESRLRNEARVERVEVAGPGFINFHLSSAFFADNLKLILKEGERFGRNNRLGGQKIIIEYTDPNPFKEFHIGHLMSNAIGEAVARLVEWSGAEVKRACYQGDVGLHVAKAIWGILNDKENFPEAGASLADKVAFLAKGYVFGSANYEASDKTAKEIIAINKKIFERADAEINAVYDKGKEWSLAHFEEIYRKLGTKFDYYFFESQTAEPGEKIVRRSIGRVFKEESGGTIVFHGEEHDRSLHTRVFINREGLPTYESKELGLAELKFERYRYDKSISITGNEINDYFRVVLRAMEMVLPDLAGKIVHLSHGMLRLPSGKMSSRTGEVVTAESLIAKIETLVRQKIEGRELSDSERGKIAGEVAIGALKYSILRQEIGGDIIYDFEKSISFEGDSGPYLQYSYVRAKSVLEKARANKISADSALPQGEEVGTLERTLHRFPEVVLRAGVEYAPHHIATYLIGLAAAFNGYYAKNPIIAAGNAPYRVALTEAFSIVMKNGLWLLGIPAPEKM